MRRPRHVADPILPHARSARRPLRQHGPVRECPSLDRPAGARALRHRGSRRSTFPSWRPAKWISAFALTEPEAGSDAANVQTRADPRPTARATCSTAKNAGSPTAASPNADRHGPHAGARLQRNQDHGVPRHARHARLRGRRKAHGQNGRARHGDRRLAFNDMFVPKENILGQLGKGLRVALTVLDFGRTTFGASCTGAAKYCVEPRSRARRLTACSSARRSANSSW